jgi:ABC-type branched-subunit amino acid transport system ATPase component/sugar phosphate permease
MSDEHDTVATLTEAVLDEEAARLAAQAEAAEARVLDDAELPGVGDESMTLREGVRVGGTGLLAMLAALGAVDQLDTGAVSLLAPDIKRSLGVSDAAIAVATIGGTLFLVAGGLVLGRLADNRRRTTIIGVATAAWGLFALLTSVVTNALTYFVTRALTGIGRSNTQVVQGPVLADAYPIGARSRVFAVHQVVGRIGGLVAPLLLGGVVTFIGGDDAWRWGFVVIGVPAIALGIAAFFLPDPPRGQFEQKDTIGEVISTEGAPPISLSASYQRIMQIRTYKNSLVALSAVGFSWVTVPVFVNLYLDEQFELSAFERALVATVPGVLAVAVVPLVAQRADALYRKSPPLMLLLIGALFIPSGVLIALQMAMPNAISFAVVAAIGGVILAAQLAMMPALFANANPYYLRAQGTAIGMAMILGIGGFGGALVGGLLADALGLRWAIVGLGLPANLVGGLLMMNGARFIRNDMSLVVEEIREAEAEHQRLLADPDDLPVLQLRNIDFSYGPVQVLFDVNLDVRRGETLALLGTNGAGKSTVLRVVSGLGIPSRGVVRLNGHGITLCSPETRVKWGIHQLPGGKAIFAPMSVRENLEMAGFVYRKDSASRRQRFERAVDVFPELRERLDDTAGSLSGGQQQMLGLAMALMHDPEVLLVDELSLGLAPVMVESLLAVVDRLKSAGQTMVIVEQSLNVALAIADRAVFMEKGRIQFEGAARELMERDDLARAVFLGNNPE